MMEDEISQGANQRLQYLEFLVLGTQRAVLVGIVVYHLRFTVELGRLILILNSFVHLN